jgi:putative transposase
MGIARSTYYHERKQRVDEADLLTAIIAICDEFEA